jgi:vacuolar iron transporter family protein
MIGLASSMRPIMRKWTTRLGLVLLAVFVAMQFVPVAATSNPPVTGDLPAPPAAKAILRRACDDCHSNETRLPWYSRIAPVSWLVARDVREGRSELNFSNWDRYSTRQQVKKLEESWEAAGEYVSVSSQADTERAELRTEREELATQPKTEEDELAQIYVRRGLNPNLARVVARDLMRHDALAAHARDELGLTQELTARPLQAALASAATFAVGAGVPVLTIVLAPLNGLVLAVFLVSLVCLAALGALAARAGGAPVANGLGRVVFWGALAMAATAGIGKLFGTTVG